MLIVLCGTVVPLMLLETNLVSVINHFACLKKTLQHCFCIVDLLYFDLRTTTGRKVIIFKFIASVADRSCLVDAKKHFSLY